jgi:phosphoribosylamine--glycine ligase
VKILVIGSGGREHTLAWKISQSPLTVKLYCAPGNPGIATIANCVPVSAGDIPGLLALAQRERIDLTVVGPEQPLADGIVDRFTEQGLKVFGPSRRASELEWSKTFAKEFMQRHEVPSASFKTFSSAERVEAAAYLQRVKFPIVIKADGLAAGKGVTVCTTEEEAQRTLADIVEEKVFGNAGERIVVEEYLEGEEASVFAVCDGEEYVMLAPAQDHKRVLDADRGKNTGGMGAYAPAPVVTDELLQTIEQRILRRTLRGMAEEGRPYTGCLYLGLMITKEGPKVIEFNARFGDPETQVVLPLYQGDLVELLVGACEKRLGDMPWKSLSRQRSGSAVCVVLTSGGYPDRYQTGLPIHGLEALEAMQRVVVFHAGTKTEHGKLVTAGGRVLGVTAILPHGTLTEAITTAYEAASLISFDGMHYRRDVGKKALQHLSRPT